MNTKGVCLSASILLLIALLSSATIRTNNINGQGTGDTLNSSESMDIIVDIVSSGSLVLKNLDMHFVNATFLPINTSMPAFNDHFSSARFSVVSGQGVQSFWTFLRVSYNLLTLDEAMARSNEVLNEFRKAFNLPLDIANTTNTVNNASSSIDVYYKLSDIEDNVEPFKELIKYSPKEGFGQLVDMNLLSKYVPSSYNLALHDIEYSLTKSEQNLVWQFSLSFFSGVDYEGENHIEVSLNDLLNHSGSIVPSTQRSSQISLFIGREVDTGKTTLLLSLNSSSPHYTELKEEGGYLVAKYNLTDSVDNILVEIDVGPDLALSWIYVALAIAAISFVSIAVLVFIKLRRQDKKDTGNMQTTSKQNPNATITSVFEA